jgi:hypothetical protein
MTYIKTSLAIESKINSTSTLLNASQTFTGIGENVSGYTTVEITITSDVDSAPQGLSVEFSHDNSNWEISEKFTYDSNVYFNKRISIKNTFIRIVYLNGSSNQTTFNLKTRFNNTGTDQVELNPKLVDSFSRLRISRPYTIISSNHITSKQYLLVHEKITGAGVSTHDANASCVNMELTGMGSIIRRTRQRGIYQPGKSLLVYMTGVLDAGNDSTITSKIGYYDDDGGYYFQLSNGIFSVVERTRVSGSLVENVITSDNFNRDEINGRTVDLSKTLIFWLNLEWLGVGFVDCGLIIDGEMMTLHRFRHSNIFSEAYMQTASLPVTYEISSTGGSGTLKQICYSVVSEGGFNPKGIVFSANTGTTLKTIGSNTVEPILAIRLKSSGNYPKLTAIISKINVMSTSNANCFYQIFKFTDEAVANVLTGASFVSADDDSGVEYDVSATAVTLTNGHQIESGYSSNNNDQIQLIDTKNNFISSNIDNLSDIIVVCITSIGPNESYCCSATWKEII